MFDDNPDMKGVSFPPKETDDVEANRSGRFGKPVAPFSELIELGKVVADFSCLDEPWPCQDHRQLMKQGFQRAVFNRIPQDRTESPTALQGSSVSLRRVPGFRHSGLLNFHPVKSYPSANAAIASPIDGGL